MKKFIYFGLCLLCFLPLCVKADKKVKVYVFTAGGCPYCEKQIEYLKSLDSYNKKFIIVEKELYVDHVDWDKGNDYDLGKKVAEEFNNHNFTDASFSGTPFVIISDIYAATYYNDDLEEIIDEAYEIGDKDAVSCISKGKDDCISITLEKDETTTDNEKAVQEDTSASNNAKFYWLISLCTFLIIATYLIKSSIDTYKICKKINNK